MCLSYYLQGLEYIPGGCLGFQPSTAKRRYKVGGTVVWWGISSCTSVGALGGLDGRYKRAMSGNFQHFWVQVKRFRGSFRHKGVVFLDITVHLSLYIYIYLVYDYFMFILYHFISYYYIIICYVIFYIT